MTEEYRKGRLDAIDEIARKMYDEAFNKSHEKDRMQKWDSGCWIRYKLFENVIYDILKEMEK